VNREVIVYLVAVVAFLAWFAEFWLRTAAPYYDPQSLIGRPYAFRPDGQGNLTIAKRWPRDIPWSVALPSVFLICAACFAAVKLIQHLGS